MSVNNFSPTIPINYLINKKLESESPITDGKVIKDLINKDVSSYEKLRMQESVNYYNIKHDIDQRTMTYYVNGAEVEDKTKSNYKVKYPYHKILIDQKVGYIVGKPIKFSTDDEQYSEALKQYLTDEFNDFVCELTKGIIEKGKEWLYIYINPEGKLDYQVFDARECIPIYDTKNNKELISLIRYYVINMVDHSGKEKTRYKVEWYSKDYVTYYIQDFQDNYVLDTSEPINPQYYWYSYNTNNPEEKTPHSWGKIPLNKFKNNEEETPDLQIYKAIIDAIDVAISDGCNNLVDIQDVIWKLIGYQGDELSEFLINLKTKKSIILDGDKELNSDAEPITTQIPHEARMVTLKELKDAIWMFGMGVDPNTDKFGNTPSGVALKFLYSLLDLKCDVLERKMKTSLREFLWFITDYINRMQNKTYDCNTVKITFNRSMIANTTEMVDNCQKSKGIISDKTVIENHPLVDDVEEEMKRIEEQQTGVKLDNFDITGGGQ